MPSRPPPPGFILLGLVMALLAVVFAAGVFWIDEGWLPRLFVGGVAALSLLAAEALWWMRPWLGRAIDTWALTCALSAFAAGAMYMEEFIPGDHLLMFFVVFAFVGMPCLRIRWYVRGHAAVAGLLPPVPPMAP